jgi:hypothetical protein
VLIRDEIAAEAWSRVSRAAQHLAARLGCMEVSLHTQEPQWQHLPRRSAATAEGREEAGCGGVAGCGKVLMKNGYLHVLQRCGGERGLRGGEEQEEGMQQRVQGLQGLVWRRAWFVLEREKSSAELVVLHMLRDAESALTLASFPLGAAQLGR